MIALGIASAARAAAIYCERRPRRGDLSNRSGLALAAPGRTYQDAEPNAPSPTWETIADNLSKAGWSWGCVSAVDVHGRTIWIADADDGKRFIVLADEKHTAFLELEAAILCFRMAPEIDHRWPQCDAHGLIMKLEIRSTGKWRFWRLEK